MEADFISFLLSRSGIVALASTRIYPNRRPQGSSLPAIVVQRISGGGEYADDGDIGIRHIRMQVDCIASTYSAAATLADAVEAGIDVTTDTVYGSTTFTFITLEDRRDLEEGGTNQESYLFRVSLDFEVITGSS